ncbi:MAG: 5-oxoprolinase [Chloroflexi bacterium]|nr:MAG: 5-oxoprolinase [Chloroflexota bacterium]
MTHDQHPTTNPAAIILSHSSKLGIDTGGTFTDFVWLDENGRFHIHKQLSTPDDPSRAILTGVQLHQIPETSEVIHGTTVATNALLQRRGVRTALITTKGFADVLAIGRQNRPDLYALVPQKPAPLIPKKWRFEIPERVTAQGDILTPLKPADLHPILAQIAADNIESVAVCLLFSYLHPEHEQLIKEAIHHATGSTQHPLHTSLSSEILPEYREYERTATTVINAYVAPLMSRYLARLADGLKPRRLAIMQSNGGIISAQTAGDQAARTALSGPAGGVVGARYIAQLAGFDNIITFDMGGTSTDVALCPGQLPTTAEGEIANLPLRLPIIDIHTVGAGGGSIAYLDAGGALHSGPESAGADPGPVCYTMSTQAAVGQPTTTDAHLVLGRLDADNFLGGDMKLNLPAANKALAQLAEKMGVATAEMAAWGVIQVANANMERAIRKISVERGYDPRRFTLVPFGGAGPLHACELAANLQIPRILIPAVPGVLSALGMLAAAPTKDYSRTVLQKIDDLSFTISDWLHEKTEALAERALGEMAAEGYGKEAVDLKFSLDMRYLGQSHELKVPFTWETAAQLEAAFHTAHNSRYGYQQLEAGIEVVNVRVTAVAPVTPPPITKQPRTHTSAETACIGEKAVWFNQQPYPTKLYRRDKLQPGHKFTGPAIVFQYDTTIVIPMGWKTAVDEYGNLLLRNGN